MKDLHLPNIQIPPKNTPSGFEMTMTEYHEWILYMANHFFTPEELRRIRKDPRNRPVEVPFRIIKD